LGSKGRALPAYFHLALQIQKEENAHYLQCRLAGRSLEGLLRQKKEKILTTFANWNSLKILRIAKNPRYPLKMGIFLKIRYFYLSLHP
jgi:hypothetical protein